VSAYSNTTQATDNQRQKQQHNKKMSRCVQCTGGAGGVFSQQFKPNGTYSRPLVCEQDSMGEMSNEFGEIWRKDWVTYKIKMLHFWNVFVVDHCSWRVVIVRLDTWDSIRRKSMANLIIRHFLDQQNFVLCQVSSLTDTSWIVKSWTVISWEMQGAGEGLRLRLGLELVWTRVRVSVKAWG